MLTGLHLLLTYRCVYECDHCFLYCGPHAEPTFTLAQVEEAIRQGAEAGCRSLCVEGGEPFLIHPLAVEAVRLGKQEGMACEVVTNCYWATDERSAELWLAPLRDLGLDDLSVSDDAFHGEDSEDNPARVAVRAARKLGMNVASICIASPEGTPGEADAASGEKGAAVMGGRALLKGRAAEKLAAGLPRRGPDGFTECSQEELAAPSRVHLDPLGNVFVCQGLAIGNAWRKPLAAIMRDYRPHEHPVVGPLLAGGPAELARRYGAPADEGFASECHLCYLVRRRLIDRFPEILGPRLVYGLAES